jgi:cell division septum initiation protein DivIVA
MECEQMKQENAKLQKQIDELRGEMSKLASARAATEPPREP